LYGNSYGYILSVEFSILLFYPEKECSPQVEFTEQGMCHGFVLWIDWVMDAKNSVVLTTGPGIILFFTVVGSIKAFLHSMPA
jgi:hypothetical protein